MVDEDKGWALLERVKEKILPQSFCLPPLLLTSFPKSSHILLRLLLHARSALNRKVARLLSRRQM